jgi:hypothetical protein
MNKYIDNQKDLIKIIIEKYNLPDDFMHDIIIDFLESYKKNINDLFSQKPE